MNKKYNVRLHFAILDITVVRKYSVVNFSPSKKFPFCNLYEK